MSTKIFFTPYRFELVFIITWTIKFPLTLPPFDFLLDESALSRVLLLRLRPSGSALTKWQFNPVGRSEKPWRFGSIVLLPPSSPPRVRRERILQCSDFTEGDSSPVFDHFDPSLLQVVSTSLRP